MAEVQMAEANVLAESLRTLARVRWPVAVDEVPGLVTSLGWTVVPGTGGRSLLAHTGWSLSRATAEFSSDRLALATVSFAVTDDVPNASPWRGRLLREAFADIAAVAVAEFGEPTGRAGGSAPQVWWDLPGGGRVEIGAGPTAVAVGAYSAEYADEIRLLATPNSSENSG